MVIVYSPLIIFEFVYQETTLVLGIKKIKGVVTTTDVDIPIEYTISD